MTKSNKKGIINTQKGGGSIINRSMQNLKLNYAIANDLMKAEILPLIRKLENFSDEDFMLLIEQLPFDIGISQDFLHEENLDYD